MNNQLAIIANGNHPAPAWVFENSVTRANRLALNWEMIAKTWTGLNINLRVFYQYSDIAVWPDPIYAQGRYLACSISAPCKRV